MEEIKNGMAFSKPLEDWPINYIFSINQGN